VARGQLALEIVKERIAMLGLRHDDIRYDLIGVNSANVTAHMGDPAEVRARVAARLLTPPPPPKSARRSRRSISTAPRAGG
jgi:hypothetical protein